MKATYRKGSASGLINSLALSRYLLKRIREAEYISQRDISAAAAVPTTTRTTQQQQQQSSPSSTKALNGVPYIREALSLSLARSHGSRQSCRYALSLSLARSLVCPSKKEERRCREKSSGIRCRRSSLTTRESEKESQRLLERLLSNRCCCNSFSISLIRKTESLKGIGDNAIKYNYVATPKMARPHSSI